MAAIALVYASRDGQTRRISKCMASTLKARGCAVDLFDIIALPPGSFDVGRYDAAIVASSIRMGKHARQMLRFVRDHREQLARMPNLFVAVSLSAHGAVDPAADERRRSRALRAVEETFARFVRDTGWTPNAMRSVAGALLYRQYGLPTRTMMRLISRMVGANTDTSRDHEYTDWAAVDRCANELADRCAANVPPAGGAVADFPIESLPAAASNGVTP